MQILFVFYKHKFKEFKNIPERQHQDIGLYAIFFTGTGIFTIMQITTQRECAETAQTHLYHINR
jgi:hypothetical protein